MTTHSPSDPFTDTPEKLTSKATKSEKAKAYIEIVRDLRQQHQLEVCQCSIMWCVHLEI